MECSKCKAVVDVETAEKLNKGLLEFDGKVSWFCSKCQPLISAFLTMAPVEEPTHEP
jgi:hypothetical protein